MSDTLSMEVRSMLKGYSHGGEGINQCMKKTLKECEFSQS